MRRMKTHTYTQRHVSDEVILSMSLGDLSLNSCCGAIRSDPTQVPTLAGSSAESSPEVLPSLSSLDVESLDNMMRRLLDSRRRVGAGCFALPPASLPVGFPVRTARYLTLIPSVNDLVNSSAVI